MRTTATKDDTKTNPTAHLVDGRYSLDDLIDLDRLRTVLEDFALATGFTASLATYPEQELLVATGWRDACTRFHRAIPASAEHCQQSDICLTSDLHDHKECNFRVCGMGLVEGATPVHIKGQHVASLFTGQVFFDKPDVESFRKQAAVYGYDPGDYLAAITDVPVITELQFNKTLSALAGIASMIGEQGLANLRLKESAESLRKEIDERLSVQQALSESERRFSSVLQSSPMGTLLYRLEPDGRLVFEGANQAADNILGTNCKQFVGMTIEEAFPALVGTETPQRYRLAASDGTPWQSEQIDYSDNSISSISGAYQVYAYQTSPNRMAVTFLDITERKLAEDTLKVHRQKLDYILRGTNVGTWEWNIQTGETSFNERWAEMIGYTLEELAPVSIDTWMKMAHPDDLKTSGELLEKHFRGELALYECEARVRHKNGNWVWVLDRGKVATRTEDGKPLLMFGTHADITERKRAEEARQDSERRFQDIVMSSADWIWETDKHGVYTYASGKVKELLGYEPDELIGTTPFQLMPEDEAERIRAIFKDIVDEKRSIVDLENWNLSKSGEEVCLLTNGIPLLGEDGQLLGYRGVDKNITDRKQAERELQRYECIVSSSNDMLALLDKDFVYLAANDKYLRAFDKTQIEMIGVRAADVFGETFFDTVIRPHAEQCLKGDEVCYRDWFDFPTVGRRYMEITYDPYWGPDNDIAGLVVNGRDITKRKLAEDAQRESEERFRSIIENTDAGYFFIDKDGIIRQVNEAWARMYKYPSTDEVIGMHIAVTQEAEDAEKAKEFIDGIMAGDARYLTGEFSRRCKDGSVGYHTFSARPVSRSGKVIGIEGFIIDATERKRAEHALADSEEKFRSLYDSMNEGVCLHELVYNEDGKPIDYRLTDVNPAYERILGLERSDAVGQLGSKFYGTEEAPYLDRWAVVAEGGDPDVFETYFPPVDKHLSISSFSPGPGKFATVFTDITQRKIAEKLSQIQRDLAHALNSVATVEAALGLCLETAIEAAGMDCGGFYLVDQETGDVNLVFHNGLSAKFASEGAYYAADSDHARVIQAGRPVYVQEKKVNGLLSDDQFAEAVTTMAILPVLHDNTVVGCINVASHTLSEISTASRNALEAIAAEVGGTISRLRGRDALRRSEHKLLEAQKIAKLGHYALDIKAGRWTSSNELNAIFGISETYQKDVVGWLRIVHPDHRKSISDYLRHEILARHQEFNQEYMIVDASSGEEKWVRGLGSLRFDEDGAPVEMFGTIQDITDRKRAEEALRDSEMRLRALSEASFEAIFVSERGVCLDQNRTAENMFDYTQAEAVGRYAAEWIAPEDRQLVEDNMRSGTEEPYEATALRKDGTTFPAEIQARMVDYKERRVRMTALRDITDRKRAAEALSESEEKYRNLVDRANDGVIISQDGLAKFVNARMGEILGFTTDEMTNSPILDYVHPDDRAKVAEIAQKRIQGEDVDEMYEIVGIHKDGHGVNIEINSGTIVYDGKPAALALVRNITDRKRAEEALRSEKEFTDTALNSQQDTFFLFEPETGKAIRWNKAFNRVTGYSDEEIAGMTVPASYYSPEDLERASVFIQGVMSTGIGTIELELVCKNGRKVPFEYNVSVIRDEKDTPKYIISVGRDITDRRQTEEALKNSMERFRGFDQHSTEGVYRVDIEKPVPIDLPRTTIIEWINEHAVVGEANNSLARMYGLEPTDMIGRPATDFAPDYGKRAVLVLDRDGYRATNQETEDIDKDGKKLYFLGNYHGVVENGHLQAIWGAQSDISERVKAEEESREKAHIIDSASSAIATCDLQGAMTNVNPAFMDMWGIDSIDEVLGRNFSDFWLVENRLDAIMTFLREEGEWTAEVRAAKRDGTLFDVQVSAAMVRDKAGNPVCLMSSSVDISERKEAEEEIHKLAALVKRCGELVNLSDLEGKMVFLNEAGGRILGLDPQEIEDVNIMDVIPDHCVELVQNELLPTLLKGEIWEGDLQYRNLRSGALTDVHAMMFTIKDPESHEPLFLANVSMDITDRKRATEALKINEERLDLAMSVANDGMWDWNILSDTSYFDPRYYTMAGYEPYEFPSTYVEWAKRVHPDDLEATEMAVKAYLAEETPKYEAEFRFKHKDGHWIWICARGNVVARDESGVSLRMIGTHADISERKRAEQALGESEARYRTLVEHAPEAIVVLDLDTGMFVDANQNAEHLYGLTKGELLGSGPADVSPPNQPDGRLSSEAAASYINSAYEGEPQVFEWAHLNARIGEERLCEIRLVRLPSSKERLLRGSVIDITDRKRAEAELVEFSEKLQEANSQLQARQQELEEFTYTVSHDLKAPVVSISGFVSLLSDKIGPRIDSTERRYLERIEGNARTMEDLLRDLLELSRIGRIDEEVAHIDMNVLVDEVIAGLAIVAAPQGVALSRLSELPSCTARPRRIQQVVTNLLDNAIKYMPEETAGQVEVGYDPEKKDPSGCIGAYFIRDNGRGLAVELHDRVFKLFQRGPGSQSAAAGTGVGLTASRRIVETHKGHLWFESDLGQGSTFYFSLPTIDEQGGVGRPTYEQGAMET